MQELNRNDISDNPWLVRTATHAAHNYQTHVARIKEVQYVTTGSMTAGESTESFTTILSTAPILPVFSYDWKFSKRIKKRRTKNKAAHKQRMKNKRKKG